MTRWEQLAYFAHNGFAALAPRRHLDSRLRIDSFRPPALDTCWPYVSAQASPSRVWSDLFWSSLPWPGLPSALGEVHVLDVGCGSGAYGPWLRERSRGVVATYTGLDLQPHPTWAAKHAADPAIRFVTGATTDIGAHLGDGVTVVMSQSVLEHVEHDLAFLREVRDLAQRRRSPLLQVHLVPSAACLRLYLLHGYRQYTPRTLSSMTELFDDDTELRLFGLGGRHSNRLHWQYITRPTLLGRPDRRATEPEAYAARLRRAIEDDLATPSSSPAFWALVIHSRPTRPLFAATC